MDALERRLIELNEALISLCVKGKEALPEAEKAGLAAQKEFNKAKGLSQGVNISDDDTVIINNDGQCQCPPGPPGEQGPPGEKGDKGDPAECECCDQKAILVSADYNILPEDYYVGVNSEEATTQTLPAIDTVSQCITKIIKVSMGHPVGNRKVTVTTADGALIDGAADYVMQSPYESITVILQGDDWHIVSHFLP